MAATAGRELLISIDTGSGSAEIVGQLSGGFSINREYIDITNKSDAAVRKILPKVAMLHVSLDFECILEDDVILTEAFDPAPSGHYACSIVVGNIGTMTGNFFLASVSVKGQDGANYVGQTATLESAGAITWT